MGSLPKAQRSCHPCSIERRIRDGIRNAVFTGVAVHLVLVLAIRAFGPMGIVRSVVDGKSSMPWHSVLSSLITLEVPFIHLDNRTAAAAVGGGHKVVTHGCGLLVRGREVWS